MSSLISLVVVDQEPRVDSRLIASQLGVEHKNTRSLIEQYKTALENFGKVPFETEASGKTNQPQKFYLLNEDQSYLLLTLTRNTDQAVQLKIRLVRAFGEQRRAIPSLDTAHDLPVIESSLVLDFQGVPIRFLIDAHGEWMATYADVATALGYVNKEQQYNARNILKYTVKAGQRQLRHPLYGDLINLAGMERVLAQLARNAACMPEPASLAVNLKEWLDKTAKSLINQPVSAGRLLEAPQARALEMTPIDWEFTQAVQVFECWFDVLGDVVLTTRQIIDRAAGTPLAGLLLDIAEGRRSPGVVSSLRLGIWLARRVGWNFNGWVLPPVITRKNDVKRWTLRKVAP
jgi:hypothetical protein